MSLLRKVAARVPFGYLLERWFLYGDARRYWEQRGGETYFSEQEAMAQRAAKSAFLTAEIAKLQPRTVLEVGCGYGKNLKGLAASGARLYGVDFSAPQLSKAKEFAQDAVSGLLCSDAENLPFRDHSIDVVFTSAVVLHNPPKKARKILQEICRVGKHYSVHNEDTNVSFSRYGIDVAGIYRSMGYEPLLVAPISVASDPSRTQFTVVPLNTRH